LQAVLHEADRLTYDRVLVLGDLVGYGAQPNEVIDEIRALDPLAIIRGNHDKVAAGIEGADGFNPIAQQAAEWTYKTLTPENRLYLSTRPLGPIFVDGDTEICHGSPGDEDAYITSELAALRALKQSERPVCFYGHTHVPVAFRLTDTGFEVVAGRSNGERQVTIERGMQYLINPGSVGQPRDGDPRAAFALFERDPRVVTLYRTPYPVERAQERIVEAGLPETLARRLALGR
jgi:diadenosine tetraphosphatase ApaH/serine/threonine PP2A family protein phosphatase